MEQGQLLAMTPNFDFSPGLDYTLLPPGRKESVTQGAEARRAGRRGWLSETFARTVAGQGYPVHDPAEAVIVVDRVVLAQRLSQKVSEPTSQRKRQVNSGRC